MLFHRVDFLIFFAVVMAFYVILNRRAQNVVLLIASYFFYGMWSWKFLGLLALTTVVDYAV
ncbi:MBOAT family protein, partial [Candidatus Sumerlaeota bacterium]|nr:MBOAT family protein [Candidatus Sumerlaeota bacterium]